ncbi:citrate synthase [candidate division TA06 bacterium DG_24]|uniref:citrate synthase (unknown stereospecificity) n=3 Tax=Bacteria division TA06 TaxID=1156500 RepID=A0A0S8JLQ5_UNCT6|nr:MAG: citrate synthase [candidate division TA06 bacterium DG_24]KPK66226.1 MAG: citrate synthase [candidate division TA06 bacterium SM23_40]KPL10673.1 MAG: citrate synthase [candidate division TA06 bacterium SM1_40]
MAEGTKWKTAITEIGPGKVSVRGRPIQDLMGKATFAQVVYLLLKGEEPTPAHGALMDAILVSSVDHGASPPSTIAARTVASTGVPLTAALASGILSIGRFHGGAVEACMKLLAGAVERRRASGRSSAEVARELVEESAAQKKRLSGFGHRIHPVDPRKVKLFSLADELGVSGDYIEMARAIEAALEEHSGKKLPINVDGAIAAVLCEMGFPAELGNAFFIIARVAGLVAQIREEQTREKPMRVIHPRDFEYDGPKG